MMSLVQAQQGEPEKSTCESKCFFQRNKSLAGFVKYTSCVKYASRVKCAAAREGDLFHFTLRRRSNISQFSQENYFTFTSGEYFTKKQVAISSYEHKKREVREAVPLFFAFLLLNLSQRLRRFRAGCSENFIVHPRPQNAS